MFSEQVGNLRCGLVQARMQNQLFVFAKSKPDHGINEEGWTNVVDNVADFLGWTGCAAKLEVKKFSEVRSSVLFEGRWLNEKVVDQKHHAALKAGLESVILPFGHPHMARQIQRSSFGTNSNEATHAVQVNGLSKSKKIGDPRTYIYKMHAGALR